MPSAHARRAPALRPEIPGRRSPRELDTLVEKAKPSPLTPEIVQEVLSGSTPVEHWTLADDSLRPFVLHHWCDFDLCTTIDYYDYAECFELDGAFAAEMMAYMAYELQWAVGRWEKQTQTAVEVNAKKKQLAEEDGLDQSMERIYGKREGAWLACRYMCTFTGCTTTDFRAYSQCFELDGTFPAHIMEYMAEELLWVVDRWGVERGRSVDFSAEKQVEEDEDAFQRMVDRAIQRAELRR